MLAFYDGQTAFEDVLSNELAKARRLSEQVAAGGTVIEE